MKAMFSVKAVCVATLAAGWLGGSPTHAQVQVGGQLLIDLHVSRGVQVSGGQVTAWTNYGAVGGVFTNDGAADTWPTTGVVSGQPAVSFDGGDRLRASFLAPAEVTGNSDDYTVEYWVLNPAIANEEWILSLARRGTSPRYAGFGYGTSSAFGVTAHWGGPDMAFGEGTTGGGTQVPAAGLWHHIVITYDGLWERAYVNGVLNAQEMKVLNIWDGDPVTLGMTYSLPFAYTANIGYSGSLAALRIHSKALTAAQIATNYLAGVAGGDQVIARAATGIGATSATVNGELFPLASLTTVWVYYGPADAGADSMAWAANVPLGELTAGPFSTELTGLTPAQVYYGRFYASNALGTAWSASFTFKTLGPPSIATLPAKAVTVTTAYSRAQLTATNGADTLVRVYYGTTDGGTDPGQWAGSLDLGIKAEGEWHQQLTGLTANTTHYYRYYASNVFGETWAAASESFVTKQVFNATGFNFTAPITFSGYTGAETLFNFPALVVFHAGIPGFSYDQVMSGGADVRFTTPDGAELNSEVETWNPAGNSYVWVQVPALTPGASIVAIWGQGGASVPASTLSGATWSDGFAGVWHMTNKYVKDSSGHGYHANYVNNPTAVTEAAGVVGGALDYNAAVGNAFTTVGVINFTNMTLSAWVWLRDANRQGMFMCKDGTPALGLGDIYFWQQGANLRFETYLWGQDTTVPVANVGGVGQWVYVVGTVNGMRQSFYTNGVLVASWDKNALGQNNNQFQLGGSFKQTGRFHNGLLDECRAEWVARSPAWIRACYDNQKSPATFETFGSVSTLSNPLLVGRPTVSDIGATNATLTIYVNGDGGNGLSSWGTVWDLTPAPTANPLVITGATNAPLAFAQVRNDFSPGTHVYVRAFASNAVDGVAYSDDAEFFLEPFEATGLAVSDLTATSAKVSWTAGTGSAGTLVVVREGAAITAVPSDGVSYTANPVLDLGENLGGGASAVYAGPDTEVTVTGLLPGRTYYVQLFAYSGSGALLNYQQDLPPTTSFTTPSEIGPGLQVAGALLIDLNAGLGAEYNELGQVTNWVNLGTAGGRFSVDGSLATAPTLGLVLDQVSVTFDGTDRLLGSIPTPPQITGTDGAGLPDDYTIEMWVMNPSIANEEWVFSWARRGTTARCAAFGYGTSAAFGALGHWGAADVAYSGGVPVAGVWHHLVAVYDGATNYVYVDGVLNTIKANTLNLWDGDPMVVGDQLNYPPLTYANIPYSGSLASLRVHSRALSAAQVATNYALGMPAAQGPILVLGQPRDAAVAEYGATAFRVTALGAPPIAYQWYSNDVAVANGTDATLWLTGLTLGANGSQFYCVLSNYANSTANVATSAVATLTVLPTEATLAHRYSFEADASDSIGTAHGTLVNGAAISDGAVVLNGVNQYVDLPNGLVTPYSNITVEAWLIDNTAGNWARIWDFGNSSAGEDFPIGSGPVGTQYMFITPQSSWGGSLRGAYTLTGGGAGEQILETPNTRLPAGVLKQVVWTSDEALRTGVLYVDGQPVATNSAMTITPAMLGITSNNWLGRSQFGADAFLNASLTEFRIYNQALPAAKVRMAFLKGPDATVSNEVWMVVSLPASRTNNLGTVATFTIDLASCVPLTYTWLFEGFELIDETNATLTIPDVQEFWAGTYEVEVRDDQGQLLTNATAVLAVNKPPVAADDLVGAGRDLPVTFAASLLATNDTDPDGDPLAVIAVSSPSTNGGTVTLVGGEVTYSPPAGFTGTDWFAYTVSDGRGGEATGLVEVTVVVVTHELGVSFAPPAAPELSFGGIPYRTYRIQYSDDLVTWHDLATVVADPTGLINYQDPTVPLPDIRFYRAVSP